MWFDFENGSFDFVRGGTCDGSAGQMFALANMANEHRFEDHLLLSVGSLSPLLRRLY